MPRFAPAGRPGWAKLSLRWRWPCACPAVPSGPMASPRGANRSRVNVLSPGVQCSELRGSVALFGDLASLGQAPLDPVLTGSHLFSCSTHSEHPRDIKHRLVSVFYGRETSQESNFQIPGPLLRIQVPSKRNSPVLGVGQWISLHCPQ